MAVSKHRQLSAEKKICHMSEPKRIKALEAMFNRERKISADLKEDRDRWRQQVTALLTDQRPIARTKSKWWPWQRKAP